MNECRLYTLLKDIPFIEKGTILNFYDLSGEVYWIDKDHESSYPLRPGLAGYLWLLLTEEKYLKRILLP